MVANTLKKMRITVDGRSYDVTVEMMDEGLVGPGLSPVSPLATSTVPSLVAAAAPAPAPTRAAAGPLPAGAIPSPLSGLVMNVHVSEGQAIKAGDLLVTLEAMKMNTPVRAPSAGTVKEVRIRQGQSVEEGSVLVVLG